MLRSATLLLGLGLSVSLVACGGDSCESLQAEIEAIGREIDANPDLVFERADELGELAKKQAEMGCVG